MRSEQTRRNGSQSRWNLRFLLRAIPVPDTVLLPQLFLQSEADGKRSLGLYLRWRSRASILQRGPDCQPVNLPGECLRKRAAASWNGLCDAAANRQHVVLQPAQQLRRG